MTLRTDYEDGVDEIDASWFNDVGTEVNALVAAKPQKGLYSALPSAGVEGRMYHATDAGLVLRDNGASWDIVATLDPFYPPPASGWSTNTLGDSSVSADRGGRLFSIAPSGSTPTPRIEYRTLSPTSNYTVTAKVEQADFVHSSGHSYAGLILRNSSNGNTILFGTQLYAGFDPFLIVTKGSTSNIRSSDLSQQTLSRVPGAPCWFRVRDNGTSRFYEFSMNGLDWVELYSGLRTDYITPDQVGWGGANATSATRSCYARLRSFNISS